MDRTKTFAGITLLLLLTSCSASKPVLRVGSKNFTEQVVLGEIIAQHVENRLKQKVERRLNLGGTLLAHEALRARQIDLYPEYTGTALATVVKGPLQTDAAAVLDLVRTKYKNEYQIDWLKPLGFNDSFAMVVRTSDARAKKLITLTDAARAGEWALGVGYEFEQRPDGMAALDTTYQIRWKGRPKSMDLGLLYKALEQGQVTMIAANSTDGLLSKMDVKILTDDKHAFPPYELCVAVREDSMRDFPGLREALEELSGKFTDAKMQELNYQVDGRHRPIVEVAREFLSSAGLR